MKKTPVVLTFNNNWSKIPACIAITSLLENAKKSTSYEIIIVHSDIEDKNIKTLITQVEKYKGHSIKIINRALADFHMEDREKGIEHTADVYTRLYLPEILEDYDKVIFADVDTTFTGDLSALYKTDLKDNYLGAVKDIHVNFEIENKLLSGFSPKYIGKYFNAGVLVMNLKQMRKDNMVSKFEKEAMRNYRYQDQDVLNVTCFNKVKYVALKNNAFAELLENPKHERLKKIRNTKEYQTAKDKPIIIHYIGPNKPWKMKTEEETNKEWWKYADKSIVKIKQNYKLLMKIKAKKILNTIFGNFVSIRTNRKGIFKIKAFKIPLFSKNKNDSGFLNINILGLPIASVKTSYDGLFDLRVLKLPIFSKKLNHSAVLKVKILRIPVLTKKTTPKGIMKIRILGIPVLKKKVK